MIGLLAALQLRYGKVNPSVLNTPTQSEFDYHVVPSGVEGEPDVFSFETVTKDNDSVRIKAKRHGHPVVNFAGPIARVVPNTFLQSGFSTAFGNETAQFHVNYGSPRNFSFYSSLQAGQMANQLPGSAAFTRKDILARNVQQMQRERPDEDFDVIPVSYELPDEAALLEQAMDGKKWFIYKQALSARGANISLLRSFDEIPDVSVKATVQEYLTDVLLVDQRKFDMRIYLLVTSIDPFVAYMYEEGVVRFAADRYKQPSPRNQHDLSMHLTNYAVNKKSKRNVRIKETLSELLDYLDQNPQLFSQAPDSVAYNQKAGSGVIRERLLKNIQDCLAKSLTAAYPYMVQGRKVPSIYSFPRRFFGYYGADIIFDSRGKAKIFEINASPSLQTETPEDFEIKPLFVQSLLNIVGIPANFDKDRQIIVPTRGKETEGVFDFPVKYEPRDYDGEPNAYEKRLFRQIEVEAARASKTKFRRILPDTPEFYNMSQLSDAVRKYFKMAEHATDGIPTPADKGSDEKPEL